MNHLPVWTFAAFLAATLAPAASTAQTGENRPYFSISGLHVAPSDSDQSTTVVGFDVSTELEWDSGRGVLLAVGYGPEIGLRGEIEIGWRKVDFDKQKNTRFTRQGLDIRLEGKYPYEGDMTTLSLMGNGIFTTEAGSLRPWFGMGFGLARHEWSQARATYDLGGSGVSTGGGPGASLPSGFVLTVRKVSDHDTVFAYQALAGVGFALSEDTEARLGYRYFGAGDAAFLDDGFKSSYETHNFEAGVLVRF